MEFEEYRTEFTMWAIAASPILIATNIASLSPEYLALLTNKDMIAMHQDKLGVAGDRIGFTSDPGCKPNYDCQVWARPMANGDVAVVLYNRGGSAHNITLEFDMVKPGWGTGAISVYDMWASAPVGSHTGRYTRAVGLHGVVALRLTGPQVGTAALRATK